MHIPVLSKIKFLVRLLWERLDHIRGLTKQATSRSKQRAETLARLAESADVMIANNTLVVEALGRLIEYTKRINDWVTAFDSYSGSARNDAQLINVIKLNVDRLLRLANSENSEKHTPNAGLLALNPELRLFDHLQRHLPCNVLIDVGAHKGDFATFLLRCGYQVYGFEPNPETFAALMARFAGHAEFRGFELALSDRDGEAMFTIPKGKSDSDSYGDISLFCTLEGHPLPQYLVTDHSIKVTIRTISSLIGEGVIPSRAGILKIDVEGHELNVLMGAERLDVDVIMAEFWAPDSEFATQGTRNNPLDLHFALRNKGYSHLITFNRVHGSTETMFHVNCPEAIKNSWGNVVFFREHELFCHALQWCDATLRRVHFGTPPDELTSRATKNGN